MFHFFKKKESVARIPLQTDIHSHLLPAIDDGVQSISESLEIMACFRELGIQKIVTTPHIMHDTYRNSDATILPKLDEMRLALEQSKFEINLNAAAEYYLDESLMTKIANAERLLTFGDRFLLFETNYLTEPYTLKDFIFKTTTQGYRPVLAHPERYQYMTMTKAEELRDRGVLLQINMLSLIGYYAKPIQTMANKLIGQKWVDFVGSDCHNLVQARLLQDVFKNKSFKKALELPLLNHSLN